MNIKLKVKTKMGVVREVSTDEGIEETEYVQWNLAENLPKDSPKIPVKVSVRAPKLIDDLAPGNIVEMKLVEKQTTL